MINQYNAIQPVPPMETWKEEFSRSRKFAEAAQKWQEEKQLSRMDDIALKIDPASRPDKLRVH